MKGSVLADLGATAEHIQLISEFAHALEKLVMDKCGKTYVEVPAPKILLPLLKKVVQKMLGAFEWARGAQEQVRQHVEQARTSLKEKLPQKKREADQQSEARWAFVRQTGKKQQINTRRKNEASL